MNWRGVMKVMRLLRWKYQGVPVTMKSAVGAARHCAESVAFDKCVISSTTGGFLAQWELADGCQQISLAFQPFQSETIGQ